MYGQYGHNAFKWWMAHAGGMAQRLGNHAAVWDIDRETGLCPDTSDYWAEHRQFEGEGALRRLLVDWDTTRKPVYAMRDVRHPSTIVLVHGSPIRDEKNRPWFTSHTPLRGKDQAGHFICILDMHCCLIQARITPQRPQYISCFVFQVSSHRNMWWISHWNSLQ